MHKEICEDYGGCKNLHENGNCIGGYYLENTKIESCCNHNIEKFANTDNNILNIIIIFIIIAIFFVRTNIK